MRAALTASVLVLLGAGGCHVLLVRAAGREVTGRLHHEARLSRRPAPARLRQAVVDASLPVDADAAWPAWMVTTGAGAVLALAFGGPGLAVVAVVVSVAAPVAVLVARRDRSEREVDAALPDVLDSVARSLRSGAAIGQALVECGDAASSVRLTSDVTAVVDDVANGAALTRSLDGWAERCPTPGVRLAVAAIVLASESGGAAARAVDGVAETLRANVAVAAEVRAQAAQARLSALVIALSPLAFGALAAGTDRQTAAFLFRTPIGLGCLVAGLALDGVAALWMHRITEVPA